MTENPRPMDKQSRLAGMSFVIHEQRRLIEETAKIRPVGEERIARYHSFLTAWMRMRELESKVAPMMPKERQEYLEQDADLYRTAHEEEVKRWKREYDRKQKRKH
jgi:hypothetical protein